MHTVEGEGKRIKAKVHKKGLDISNLGSQRSNLPKQRGS